MATATQSTELACCGRVPVRHLVEWGQPA